MKKHLLIVATALLAVGLLAGPALAQDSEKDESRQRHGMREKRGEGEGRRGDSERGERMKKYAKARYRMMKSRLIRELDLSDKKADEVREVFKAHAADRKEAGKEKREEIKELHQEIEEARDAGDEEKTDKLWAEIKEIWAAEREQGRKELLNKLSDVLDEDQLAKAERILKPRKGHRLGQISAALRTMDLDEDQIKKIDGIMEDASKKIVETLNPEQKEQLEKKLKRLSGAKKIRRGWKGHADGERPDHPKGEDKDGEHPRRHRDRGRDQSSEDKK